LKFKEHHEKGIGDSMLNYLKLKHVCLAPELRVDWAPRFNLITGDNGLGKSFLLDLSWWALTRTWTGAIALPTNPGKATIEYEVRGKAKTAEPVISVFRREDETWPVAASRPPMPGIVVYIRIDGGFSVWDPARNYWRSDPGRPAAYHFSTQDVWNGLDVGGQRVCEGLERDWVSWQEARKPQFHVLEKVLETLSPVSEPLRAGTPRRLFIGEGRDRPTLRIGAQDVPVALASAGVRRILALAYFLVWAWHEHEVAAQLLGKKSEKRFVILFDEPETHLHPRWQRTIIPSLLKAVEALREEHGVQQYLVATHGDQQLLVATHSPLVAASLEPLFDSNLDDLIHLNLKEGRVVIEQGRWAAQGDATNWLVSETFGLEQARSLEAEKAIEAAEAFMRNDKPLPPGLDSKKAISEKLEKLLPAHDDFWPRWLVETGSLKLPKRGKP
jgi:predicted ATPase